MATAKRIAFRVWYWRAFRGIYHCRCNWKHYGHSGCERCVVIEEYLRDKEKVWGLRASN